MGERPHPARSVGSLPPGVAPFSNGERTSFADHQSALESCAVRAPYLPAFKEANRDALVLYARFIW